MTSGLSVRQDLGDVSEMSVVTGLLLDVDDTLIDTRAAMVAAGEAAVAELWPQVSTETRHAAAVRFRGDPNGFFGRFTTGELTFTQMRRARGRSARVLLPGDGRPGQPAL